MIVKEINEREEKRMELAKMRVMLDDVILPKGYTFLKEEYEISIYHKGFLGGCKIADIYLVDNQIVLSFGEDYEEEWYKLKPFFEKSKSKFIFRFDGFY